ncbi:MAG TPA: dTDP-glucose 4,6-dehydratase [Candidatus Woesebacteria bacterium]|nr:dTDP-glucose 4,6-dehydratase [Candidatus Woesebacteria bacterium]
MINKNPHQPLKILVTGGAGFIGVNFLHYWAKRYPDDALINLDSLTYAGNLSSCQPLESHPNYHFIHGSINDTELIDKILEGVEFVVHFAAETHVDRSIAQPDVFLQTNVLGTHTLLKAALKHKIKRFHHVSTDEVFGTLNLDSKTQFNEHTPYAPRSPYSASKAASDHLVRSYGETFGLPYTITNCSNNYGEYHFPEKLFPLAITNLIENKKVPVYGSGKQVRDWLYVQDHCAAIEQVLLNAPVGETYLVGGLTDDISNLDAIKLILKLMNKSESEIEFVADRPGHDQRYSVCWDKIREKLGWQPSVDLEQGLTQTIEWYQQHREWWQPLKNNNSEYFSQQYPTL